MHQLSELAAIAHPLPVPALVTGPVATRQQGGPEGDAEDANQHIHDSYEPHEGDLSHTDDDDDHFVEICDQIERDRREYAENLEAASHGMEEDPLILALQEEWGKKQQADARIRQILAYAREFYPPRRYKLEELAQASGYKFSSVRTAYGDKEITQVADQIKRPPTRATTDVEGGQQP
ncbi:hypothetical protein ACFWU3_34465 [Streptomyces sp. NPDC058685]|uniref:hypothetical protein n=1 Tax=Streptomyces sp. NPDC058685 TaxID=3346598 RepID=UPI00364B8F1B